MKYRLPVFLIGLTLMAVIIALPPPQYLLSICAGTLHGLVLADCVRPGTIESLLK